ncbi:MAG: hypothetical protein ABI651_19615 [Verrucomicrobiota bacterium]
MSITEEEQFNAHLHHELDSLMPVVVWACERMENGHCVRIASVRRRDRRPLSHPVLVKMDIVLLAGVRQVARFVCNELAPGGLKDSPPTKMEISEYEQ